jgi:S-adenosylmethionine synthetase
MKIKLVERKRFSWHVPIVVKCSTPFASLPAMEKIVMEIERFINPPEPQVEKVTPKDGEQRRAR